MGLKLWLLLIWLLHLHWSRISHWRVHWLGEQVWHWHWVWNYNRNKGNLLWFRRWWCLNFLDTPSCFLAIFFGHALLEAQDTKYTEYTCECTNYQTILHTTRMDGEWPRRLVRLDNPVTHRLGSTIVCAQSGIPSACHTLGHSSYDCRLRGGVGRNCSSVCRQLFHRKSNRIGHQEPRHILDTTWCCCAADIPVKILRLWEEGVVRAHHVVNDVGCRRVIGDTSQIIPEG